MGDRQDQEKQQEKSPTGDLEIASPAVRSPFYECAHHDFEDIYVKYAKELEDGIRSNYGNGPPDPEDVVHEAFERVFSRLGGDAIKNIRGFLWRTARNLVLQDKRSRTSRSKYDFEVEQLYFPIRGANLSPENIIVARDQISAINACLSKMPERRRRAFVLYRTEGVSMDEIAAQMAISRTAVRKHIIRADQDIAALLLDVE